MTIDNPRGAGDGGQESGVGGQRSENLCVSVYPVAPEDGTGASLREKCVGSVFRVFLPLMEGEVLRAEKKPVTGGDAPQRGGKVLLVEDTEQVRKLGVRMLERLGWQVIAARDGMEGVELFRTQQNDIRFVLSDLSMPGMDGWKTIEALRGHQAEHPCDPRQRLRRGHRHERRPCRIAPGLSRQAVRIRRAEGSHQPNY